MQASIGLLLQQIPAAVIPAVQLPALAAETGIRLPTASAKSLQVGELADRRTRYSKTSFNKDRTFTTSIYAAPINYLDAQGNWQPIDSRLVSTRDAGYAWRNKANSFAVLFKDRLRDNYLRFDIGGHSFSFSLDGAAAVPGQAADSHVSYGGAFPGVSLGYGVEPAGVEETLVLANAGVPHAFHFTLSAPASSGVRAVGQADGSWAFVMPRLEAPLFFLAAPRASDATGALRNGSLAVSKKQDGFTVELALDSKWLRDAARRFPVRLDPTITIQPDSQDASFQANCTPNLPTTTCTPTVADRVFIGTDATNAWRTAIQFNLSSVPANTTVTTAKLGLYYDGFCLDTGTSNCGGVAHAIEAHRMTAAWSTTTTTQQVAFDPTTLSTFTLQAGSQSQWMSWDLTGTVQSWLSGTQSNFGLYLMRNPDGTLGTSGPTPPGTNYTGNPNLMPKLDIAYGSAQLALGPIATVHANGADLSWSKFDDLFGTFSMYEVHRSATSGFTPSSSTLVATIGDEAITTYRDTTAAPGQTFYYEVVANGTIFSNQQKAMLPADGGANKLLQPGVGDGLGAVTYLTFVSGSTNCANYGRSTQAQLGTTATNIYRTLLNFNIRDIALGSVIQSASVSLYHTNTPTIGFTAHAYRVTRAWAEGTGSNGQCTGNGATWYDTTGGVQWTSAGGDFDPTQNGGATVVTGEAPTWNTYDVTAMVRQWVNDQTSSPTTIPAANLGLLIKADDETQVDGRSVSYAANDYVADPTLRPKLAIVYTDNSHALGPAVAMSSPAPGSLVNGSVSLTAAAASAQAVDHVEFWQAGSPSTLIGTATAAPFSVTWNTTGMKAVAKQIYAKAYDLAGNSTTSVAISLTVGNTTAPATILTAPKAKASLTGTVTVSASPSVDSVLTVSKVEFYSDGSLIGTATASPWSIAWNTLDPNLGAFDGAHTLNSKVYDSLGQVASDSGTSVTMANTSGTEYQAGFSTSAPPQAMVYDPTLTTQVQAGVTVTLTNNSSVTWPASNVFLHYRWLGLDGSLAADGGAISLGSNLPKGKSVTLTVLVNPPVLPDGVARNQYRLRFDLQDTSANAFFGDKGNPPNENPVDVNHALRNALGLERYYQYVGLPVGGAMRSLVNVANGNSILRWTPFEAPGRGLATVVNLTYNSLEDHSDSPAGNNVSISLSSLTRFGLPLDIHPNNADTIAGNTNRFINLIDGDGTPHRFDGHVASDGSVYWTEPAGVHLYLRQYSTTDTTRWWAFTGPDRVTFFYNQAGYPTYVTDKNGNTIGFLLQSVDPSQDPGGPKFHVTNVIDPAGMATFGNAPPNRMFTINYYTSTDTRRPHVRGKIKSILDHESHELDFFYYDDGNLLKLTEQGGTNADGSPLAARSWVFTYTTSGGQPSTADPVNPDPGTANESTRLYSVLDPRGNKTVFSYITSGQDKWKLATLTDRAGNVTSYSYDDVNQVTTVTAPLSRVTKYAYDSDGKPTSVTNPILQTTSLTWSPDFAVTKITEPTGATTLFSFNDNGYLTDQYDQLSNHTKLTYQNIAVDGNDVSGKWSTIGAAGTGRTIPHISQLATKADPLGNTFQFAYDSSGDLTQVTDPLKNLTNNAFNADGTMASTTDANNHTTTYSSYDLMGQVTKVTDAAGGVTQFGYTDSGKLQWIQDANHTNAPGPAAPLFPSSSGDPSRYRTYFYYDSFHRMGAQSTPKSFSVQLGLLIWADTQYDPNDNVVAKIDPHYGLQDAPGGAGTRTTYDAVDRQTQITGPDASADPQGERTQFVYDAASRLTTVTLPNGVQTPNGSAFQISYTYDGLDRMISRSRPSTDASGTHTSTTISCYNTAGDLTSVTAPNAGLTASTINCSSPTLPLTTAYVYDADHRVVSTTDPDGHSTSSKYDAAGNVVQATDANGNQTTNSYDALNRLVQTTEPFITGTSPRTLTTITRYDAVGNVAAFISARAYDAAGGSGTYTRFVTTYHYDVLNRLVRTDLPVDPTSVDSRYNTQYYAHQAYDAIGNLVWTALPDPSSDPAQVPASKKTVMTYWDRAWIRTSKDPANPAVHFDYTAQGWQSLRVPETPSGQLDYSIEILWSYLSDGQLQQLTDQGGLGTAYTYDADNNMVSAFKVGGVTSSDQSPLSVQLTYDQVDRAAKVREKRQQDSNYTATTYSYNLDGSTLGRIDNQIETAGGSVVTAGRQWHFDYDGTDWLVDQCSTATAVSSCAASTGPTDLRSVNTFVPTGWEQQREIDQGNGAGGWTPKQFTNWDYFANGNLHDVTVQNGAHTTLQSDTVSYTNSNNIYNNGNRVQDVLTLKGPDSTAPCYATACTASYQYDPRDRLIHEDNGHGGVTDYTLDGAGNILTENQSGNMTSARTSEYLGNQLQQTTTTVPNQPASVQKYFYDPLGNLQCVTTGGGSRADCNVATGGTPTVNLLSYDTYDYLNRLIGYHAYTGGTGTTATNTATYAYDTLNRMASETETHGSTPSRTTSLGYIGMTGNVAEEQQTSGGTLQTTKDYSYDIVGHRLAMTVTPNGSAATTYGYGYNVHGSVSLLVDPTGNAKAAYGYRPYGDPDTALTKGDTDPTNPFNPYRYSAQRLDSATASLDAGARRFDPGTAHFLQADSFNGSLSDQGLASDPLGQNRYALGGGNPLDLRETDGHMVAADGGGGSYDYPNPDTPPPPPPPSRAKPCNGFLCGAAGLGMGILDTGRDFVGGLKNAGGAVVHAVTHPSELPGDAAAVASITGTGAATFIHDPAGTSRKVLAAGFQAAAGAVDSLHTAFTAGDDFSRWRAYGHFTSSVVAAGMSGPAAVKAVSLAGDAVKGIRLAGAARDAAVAAKDVSSPVAGLPRAGSALKVDTPKDISIPGGGVREFGQAPLAHGFSDIIDNYAGTGSQFALPNGAALYQVAGSQAGIAGRFEWIVDNATVTHRMFVAGGAINGIPIEP